MTLDEVLKELRDLEICLRSAGVQRFFQNQPEEIRSRFVSFRQEISLYVGKLTNARLKEVADKLDELSNDIKLGISHLQGKIDKLNDSAEILNYLGGILGLVARITVLAK